MSKICFFISPSGAPGSAQRQRADQVYRHIVEPVTTPFGYQNVRADQIARPGIINDRVIEHLLEADLVVADLTGLDPNVFYKLAVRHVLRRPFVQMMDVNEDTPFDQYQQRTIRFDHRDLDSVEYCREELKRQIDHLEDYPGDLESPIGISVDQKAFRRDHTSDNANASLLYLVKELIYKVDGLSNQMKTMDYPEQDKDVKSAELPMKRAKTGSLAD